MRACVCVCDMHTQSYTKDTPILLLSYTIFMVKLHWRMFVFLFLFNSLYLSEGFLHLQNLVTMSIIEQIIGDLNPSYNFTEIPINVKVGFVMVIPKTF